MGTPEQDALAAADAADDAAAQAGTLPVTPAEPFRGGWAETPTQQAARAAKLDRTRKAARPHLHEIPLRYPPETYLQVAGGLRVLAELRGVTIRDVVAELVAAELTRTQTGAAA